MDPDRRTVRTARCCSNDNAAVVSVALREAEQRVAFEEERLLGEERDIEREEREPGLESCVADTLVAVAVAAVLDVLS